MEKSGFFRTPDGRYVLSTTIGNPNFNVPIISPIYRCTGQIRPYIPGTPQNMTSHAVLSTNFAGISRVGFEFLKTHYVGDISCRWFRLTFDIINVIYQFPKCRHSLTILAGRMLFLWLKMMDPTLSSPLPTHPTVSTSLFGDDYYFSD